MNNAPDKNHILQRGTELMKWVAENSDQISAICHDSNDDLTILALVLALAKTQGWTDERYAETAKMSVMAAFYIGYRVGKKEGDVTIWEEGGGTER